MLWRLAVMSGRHAEAWAAVVPQYHGVRLVAVFGVGRVWPVYFLAELEGADEQ